MTYHLHALPTHTLIRDFRILHLIGIDRFGFCYEGTREIDQRKVIVREFFPFALASRQNAAQVACDPLHAKAMRAGLERLQRLADKLREFSHPNLVEVLAYVTTNGTGYLIMADADGMMLETWLRARTTPPEPAELRPVIDPVLDGLSAMHGRGGVHQDVSPQSIVILPDGRPILAGKPTLADVVARVEQSMPDGARIDDAGSRYRAPEQTWGATGLGLQTDIYAAGAVLYRAFAGNAAIEGARRVDAVRSGLPDPYVPISDAVALPPHVARIIDRALALRIQDRLESIDQLRIGLGWLQAPSTARDIATGDVSGVADAPASQRRSRTKSEVPTGQNPLPLSDLAALRRDTAIAPPTSVIAAAPPVAPRRSRRTTWLGGLSALALAGLAVFELGDHQIRQARVGGEDPSAPALPPNYVIVSIAALVATGTAAWLLRSQIAGLFDLVKSELRSAWHRRRRSSRQQQAQLVEASVFAPPSAPSGHPVLIQVYLHTPDAAHAAKAKAREADPDTGRRGNATLNLPLSIGQTVRITLEASGLQIDEPVQSLAWRGEPCACQFFVQVPPDATNKVFSLRVSALLDSIPLGTLRFTLTATRPETPSEPIQLRGEHAHRYRQAFLSYASPDRAQVLKCAQALQAAQISFFQDLLKLEPGQQWEKRLYDEIDRCDLFLLFWSSHAVKSEWVIKEAEYALKRFKAASLPDISPIILEGPPVPRPPNSLKEIHFNDPIRYVIAAIEAERNTR